MCKGRIAIGGKSAALHDRDFVQCVELGFCDDQTSPNLIDRPDTTGLKACRDKDSRCAVGVTYSMCIVASSTD